MNFKLFGNRPLFNRPPKRIFDSGTAGADSLGRAGSTLPTTMTTRELHKQRVDMLLTCDGVGKLEKHKALIALMTESFNQGQQNILYAMGLDDDAKKITANEPGEPRHE